MSRTVLSFVPEGLKQFLHDLRRDVDDLKRVGSWQFDTGELEPEEIIRAGGAPHLLVMLASSDSIASGGDYVTFGSVVTVYGFNGGAAASDSWAHPASGVYVLTYDHAWDTYTGGGTIQVEVDGVLMPEGLILDGTAGQDGDGTVIYHALAGSVGRIYIDHGDASAQTCTATVRVAISDPSAGAITQWSAVFSGDVWDATFDGTYWWTTEGDVNTVSKRDAVGSVLASFAASGAGALVRGVTWDGANLWVTGAADGVYQYDTSGALVGSFALAAGETHMGVAFDGADLWVAETDTDQLRRYSTTGTLELTASIAGTSAGGAAFYGGDVFVVDQTTAMLNRYDATGALVDAIDISGAGAAPTGAWIDAAGSLYVAVDGDGLYRRNTPIGA